VSHLFSGEKGSNFNLGCRNRSCLATIYSFPQILLLNSEKGFFKISCFIILKFVVCYSDLLMTLQNCCARFSNNDTKLVLHVQLGK
jgi:hypothetical protein